MIIEKPWGKEEILEKNDKYMLKRLIMYRGKRCSLQYHNNKTETIYILDGTLNIYILNSDNILECMKFYRHQSVTINPKVVHRMEAIIDTIYLEASTPEIDDVVRLEDDYKRT